MSPACPKRSPTFWRPSSCWLFLTVPIEQDCIHFQNGVYHLPDGSFQESRLFCQNRLPVKYDPKAATPDRWLTFLHELLDEADIPTLQEYLGYCLMQHTKGQKMMLIVARAARASPHRDWC